MQHRLFKSSVVAVVLALFMGASAAAQSGSNARYYQFADTAAASVSSPASGRVRLFFDSTGFYWKNSSGTSTAVGGTLSGLTTGVIPQAGSATTIVDSKMTTSGANSGTWTLYDSGGTGITAFNLRAGASQSTNALATWYANDGTTARFTFASNGVLTATVATDNELAIKAGRTGATSAVGIGDKGYGSGGQIDLLSGANVTFTITAFSGIEMGSDKTFLWSSSGTITGGRDLGLARSAAGILKVTDGSTGQGGIGIADSATNTVSDALILRHQGGTVAGNGFGTGLLFQGENDGGVMHDMASIDAIYTLDDDTAENTRIEFRVLEAGAETRVASISRTGGLPKIMLYRVDDSTNGEWLEIKGGAGSAQFTIQADSNGTGTDRGIDIIAPGGEGLTLQGAGSDGIRFTEAGVAHRWQIPTGTGHFVPITTNTYDIGTSSAFVKSAYVSTSIQGTRTKTLTDNTITDVVQISSAVENNVTAGHISYTVIASDATNELVQTEVGQVPFLLVNENGTVTVTLGTVAVTAIDSAGGAALANTFASSVSGTNAMLRVTSDYDQATLTGTVTHRIEYRVFIDSGTATVTPQ